jgi:hypothetical protein
MGASMSHPAANHKSFVFGDQDLAWKQFETALRWNAQTFAAYTTIASKMQSFIARRINEDLALLRSVSQCSEPHEHMAVYTNYCRKAAEDYGKEVTTVAKLMTNAGARPA